MPKQQQYLTMKFNSDRLKKFNYDIQLTIDEAIENNELIAIFENQLIDSILHITERTVDVDKIEEWKKEIKKTKKLPTSVENGVKIKELYNLINNEMFIPEYITIKMNNKNHYKHMFKNGVKINGVKYCRFNSSASQARVNTVLFVAETVFHQLRAITDNGRNLDLPIAPAKLNAYRGLYGSSRFKVSTPRFCVVKDFESECDMDVNFVTETDKNEDDLIEVRKLTRTFNRFDGQGLISPSQARKWAEELELNYVPSQFCIRGSFLKGMLCVFDIHEWIKEENNGNSIIETIYKDSEGEYIKVDLNEVDVIITESQLKLWDSWNSVEHYVDCCNENGLGWGVTLYTPEFDKTFFYENYQFLQTLNLDDNAIIKITSKFIKWIKGATSENVYYTMLFLVGMDADEDKFLHFLKSSTNYWAKALIIEPQLINDKYIRTKLYNLLRKKIKNASLGQIIVDGNFQVIVSDPYAMMEAICGKEVNGLLSKGEYYSNYWNENDVKQIVGSRSPLTYRSEHVIMDLVKNDETEKWYKYCKSGIILNAHGDDTDRFAGSDFDYDILATTSDENIINGVYRNELPVVYDAPKPKKIVPTEEDLYNADLFSFDSIIGGLTNKSTSGYALLADLEYGSLEYEITLNRIKSITKAQSAQIDKTKIGQNVKGIVPKWVKYSPIPRDERGEIISESNAERKQRELNNRLLLDKHPYFFIHLYKNTSKAYKNHIKQYEILCLQRLGITLDELKNKNRSIEEQEFYDEFYSKSPVIESNCVMNKICRRIESIDFEIKNLLKSNQDDKLHKLFLSDREEFNTDTYKKVIQKYKDYNKKIRGLITTAETEGKNKNDMEVLNQINVTQESFKNELLSICSNSDELVNYIINMFYVDYPSFSKDIMWSIFGDEIVTNLISKKDFILIPVLDENGDMEYLNNNYSIREVALNELK